MDLTDQFDTLDKLICEQSTETAQMLEVLDRIRRLYDASRFMGEAQDRLHASIARGHRKVLEHLEAANISEAMREAAGAVAWFHHRFEGADPTAMTKFPHIAEELREVRDLASRSTTLREALTKGHDIHAA